VNDHIVKDKLLVEKIVMHLNEISTTIELFELDSCEKMTVNDNYIAYYSIVMGIVLVGKSVRNLSLKFKKTHNNIAWQYLGMLPNAIGVKDTLNEELIWKFAVTDAPVLHDCFRKILEEA